MWKTALTFGITLALALALAPAICRAQATPLEHRIVTFVEGGYARTIAPESLIGDGPSVSAGGGVRLTPGKTLQGVVSYVSYYHDAPTSTIDGRIVFIGAEIAFQSNRPRVRPFASVGAGIFDVEDVWVKRREISPGRWLIDPALDREFTLRGMTASGGIDFRVNEHASIRAGARFHGVLEAVRPDDAIPFMIFRPSIGAMWRW